MNCPNCGTPEYARVKVCRTCGEAFASEDLQKLNNLQFLVDETAGWGVDETLRAPYIERVEKLLTRLKRLGAVDVEAAAEAIPVLAPEATPPTPEPILEGIRQEPEPITAPPRETVPFDQWLLSERNIKIALYAGGLLLVLAGLIFIGVNWTRIPGPGKFAITLLATGLMYLGGYLLVQRPAYRIGGVALLGVASGFLTLNFAVMQIYVLGQRGLQDDVMWLIASPLCMLLYILTAYWIRADLFSYISLAALISTLTALLVVVDAPILVFPLAYSLLVLALLFLGKAFQATRYADFTHQPLMIVSQVGMPAVILGAIVGWVSETGCSYCSGGSPWLAILALGAGALFYGSTDYLYKWIAARWAAAVIFTLTFAFALVELDFSDSATGITMMFLALAYLGIGYILERREGKPSSGWPLYALAYIVALFITSMAIPEVDDVAEVMFGNVILLAVSAAIHRKRYWVYGAVWLFILPVYLVISLNVPAFHNRGLLMGVLGLNYVAAGYALGRRELRVGGPFLTAAAFLSILTVVLAWNNTIVVTLLLVLIGVLYLLVALWLEWSWLLFPAFLAVNLAVFTINDTLFTNFTVMARSLIISYTVLGFVLAFGGLGLRRTGRTQWAWPLYIVAGIDLVGSYAVGLFYGDWLAFSVSLALSAILLVFSWLERDEFIKIKIPSLLTYLGIGVFFGSHFYLFDIISSRNWSVWPGFTAGLCGLFVVLAWLLRREGLTELYSNPLRLSGLWLMILPMVGAVAIFEPVLGVVTFAIAGATYISDAVLRRILNLAYVGFGAFIVVIWAVLLMFEISEPQAYTIPLGVALLGMGWNERRLTGGIKYRLPTLLGLLILFGSTFIQSVPRGGFAYAMLLLVESLISIWWGIRTRLRGYVQLGVLALIANTVVQLGPGFVDLPRWVQIGITGGILFVGGIGALFKREAILSTRKKLTDEWRRWEP